MFCIRVGLSRCELTPSIARPAGLNTGAVAEKAVPPIKGVSDGQLHSLINSSQSLNCDIGLHKLNGRLNRPPRASEYLPPFVVGSLEPLEKLPGSGDVVVAKVANAPVVKGRGNSFGKYPLDSKSNRDT